jgi:predicted nucleic acid-binding protein
MKKVMLDTNEYDKLLGHSESYGRLLQLLAEGKIELISTHIQRDEIMAITDDDTKKARLEAILSHARMIPTRGAAYGVSRYGLATYGRDEDHRIMDKVRDVKDGLIAATASSDADTLVTNDKDFANRLRNYPGNKCEIMDFAEFERRLADLA